jgi:hypothetical protein
MMKRQLTNHEKEIIEKLLSVDFPDRDILKQQAALAEAEPIGDSDNYGSIYLSTDQSVPRASVKQRVPVEGLVVDATGEQVNILLHVIDGIIAELEIVKLDGTPIQGSLDASRIDVIVNVEKH